jgi:hypothetical protein
MVHEPEQTGGLAHFNYHHNHAQASSMIALIKYKQKILIGNSVSKSKRAIAKLCMGKITEKMSDEENLN